MIIIFLGFVWIRKVIKSSLIPFFVHRHLSPFAERGKSVPFHLKSRNCPASKYAIQAMLTFIPIWNLCKSNTDVVQVSESCDIFSVFQFFFRYAFFYSVWHLSQVMSWVATPLLDVVDECEWLWFDGICGNCSALCCWDEAMKWSTINAIN